MKVLVLNAGSTSIKYNLYEMDTEEALAGGSIERVGAPEARHKWRVRGQAGEALVPVADHRAGVRAVLEQLTAPGGPVSDVGDVRGVGHRVVHGGESLVRPTVVDDRSAAHLDPLSAAPRTNRFLKTVVRFLRSLAR